MKYFLLTLLSIFVFTGCNSTKLFNTTQQQSVIKKVRSADYNEPYAKTNMVYQDLNGAIDAIADELFISNINKDKNTSVILTSFVDLNQLNQTTTFGRLLGESMFNELHIRHFRIVDFRGQDAVSVNADGEFHITRDVTKLKDHIEAIEYIVVGTYVKFEGDSVLLNARILDSETGEVISTARIIYKPVDCALFDICYDKKINNHPIYKGYERKNNGISIITDGCSKVSCPSQNCKEGICDNSALY